MLILYAVTLWATNRNWAEAARLSRTIVADIASESRHDAVIVLNAPDNIRGAYLFRNGLDQALLSFVGDERVEQTHVIIHHRLNSARDEIKCTKEEGGISLRPTETQTEFDRYDAAPACLTVVEPAKRLARFRLDGCDEKLDVFYFSEGRMRRIKAE